jgi:hypothetical protein
MRLLPIRVLTCLALLSVTTAAFSQSANPAGASHDSVSQKPLFLNDRDLTGWRSSRPEDATVWSVENGELVGKSPEIDHNAFLISDVPVGNFRFSCEVKLVENVGNSGVQFRSQRLDDGAIRGYQADIAQGWWGKLYEENGRELLVDNDAEKFVRPGEWNTYEIIAVGSRIQLFLNGQSAVDLNDPEGARQGFIALQVHEGDSMEVRFRNLKLTPLSPLPPYAAQGSPPDIWPMSLGGSSTGAIAWRKTELDGVFRSEGCCIADLDNDGDMDLATGSVWYEQLVDHETGTRSWQRRLIQKWAAEFNPKYYSDSFMNYADDLNGDGWLDLIVIGLPGKPALWYANPGEPEKLSARPWKQYQVAPVTGNESPAYLDLDRDGIAELLCASAYETMAMLQRKSNPSIPWRTHSISAEGAPRTKPFSHGLGAGDINSDGRFDVVIPEGWWECPEAQTNAPWKFHTAELGADCSQMYVYDFDRDGDADVLSTSAHRFGIWWHEQKPPVEGGTESAWETHLIDESISQTHSTVLADINGDGIPDLITGRRHWAHSGRDPGEDQPPVLCWFELRHETGRPVWTKHEIDNNSGVGTMFEVADVNADGLLDIVTSNKRGTFLLEQVRDER